MVLMRYVVIYFAGTLAGFINVLGGGGSMVTLPLLMWMGLPATLANGTNRIAILLQNAVGIKTFASSGVRIDRSVLPALVFASAGSIIGSLFVSTIDKAVLDKVIAVVLLAVVFLVIFGSGERKKGRNYPPLTASIFLAVGFYGGFIQAGVGFFLIAAITYVFGFDLVRTNMTKITIVFVYTIFSVLIFAFKGMIDWLLAVILALGNMTGAFLAARLALRKGSFFLKWILVVVVVANAIKYLFF